MEILVKRKKESGLHLKVILIHIQIMIDSEWRLRMLISFVAYAYFAGKKERVWT